MLVGQRSDHPCATSEPQGLDRLYVWHRRRRPERAGWAVHGVEIAPDRSLRRLWTHVGSSDFAYPNSNLVTTHDASGQPGLVILPLDGEDPQLLLLDSGSGEVVDRIPFDAVPYFTMPVVVGERIYLASRNDAVLVFEPDRPSVWAVYRRVGFVPSILGPLRRRLSS